MRIISQDGKIDVPYEMTAIHLLEGSVLMNMVGDTGKGSVIARYSTCKKAQKAMEMLHEAYACERYFQFPSDEDVSGSGTKRSKSFGEKVLNILKHKGISQRELAEKVGCTEVSMSRYISGERVPKAPIVVKIADVLGVPVEYLVSDSIE